jgi:peroxiredoxin
MLAMLRAFSVLIVSALVASFAMAATTSGPAPNFKLQSRDGKTVSLSDYKGQVVLVNFWATWCGPCRQEMPHLEAIYEKYKGLGFTMLGVNVEDNASGAKKWLEENGPVTFPVLFDTKQEIGKLYKVETMPTTVIIARDGTMRFIHHGYKPGYEGDYQTQVRQLLKE